MATFARCILILNQGEFRARCDLRDAAVYEHATSSLDNDEQLGSVVANALIGIDPHCVSIEHVVFVRGGVWPCWSDKNMPHVGRLVRVPHRAILVIGGTHR